MRNFWFLLLLTGIVYGECDSNTKKLVLVYDEIVACENNYLIWKDGTKMIYDDGIDKSSFQKLLDIPDIKDMFYMKYPVGPNSYTHPEYNYDPGRIRNEAFMKKLYGYDKQEVSRNLVRIAWLPNSTNKMISVSSKNNLAKQLRKVSAELDQLPERFKKYITTTAGTFNWRKISGTSRLSVHSFGAAIDLNVKYASYWKWKKKYAYHNQVPKEIVEIFEKHGFIWGGKWYHYDTMHFEYRPELLK